MLDVQKNDFVTRVTFNRPDVHNAFNAEFISMLTQAVRDIADDRDCRLVLFKGAGKSFSAGADLKWMKDSVHFTQSQNKEDAMALAQMLKTIHDLPQLTVAQIHGAAMGGGMGLASVCDVVFAERETKFALSEVKLGLIPATIAPYVIAAIGARQAKRYFQTAERISATKAQEIGLVHEVYDGMDKLEFAVHVLIDQIRLNGPHAMREAKSLWHYAQMCSDDLLEKTAEHIAEIRAGDEAQEGLGAFFDKRIAKWAE
jgi:methylglutaconyl-CoA hydratase